MYKGNLALLEKKPIDAEATFKKIIELAPENPIGYSRLGFLYLLQKKHEKALQRFAKALRLQPGYREALTYSVSIYLEKKQFDTALTFCDEQLQGLEKDSLESLPSTMISATQSTTMRTSVTLKRIWPRTAKDQ